MPNVQAVLAQLKRKGTKRNRDGMARYAIVAPKVMGVSVGDLRAMGIEFPGRYFEPGAPQD